MGSPLAFLFRTKKAAAPFGCRRSGILCVEHILQLFEEALAFFVVFFFQRALKLLQGITLRLVQLFGDLHLALDIHITTAAAVQILDGTVTLSPSTAWLKVMGTVTHTS